MREAKFRVMVDVMAGSTMPEKEWKYWSISQRLNSNQMVIDWETLGEFTGVKDDSGVEWYEGDICQNTDEEEDSKFQILWNESCFKKRYIGEFDDFLSHLSNHDLSWFRVIGNIHENPDLLTGSHHE